MAKPKPKVRDQRTPVRDVKRLARRTMQRRYGGSGWDPRRVNQVR